MEKDLKTLLEEQENLDRQFQDLVKMRAEIEKKIRHKNLKKEIKRLDEITDELNSIFQDEALKKHCYGESNELYDIMQHIDHKVQELSEEHGIDPLDD